MPAAGCRTSGAVIGGIFGVAIARRAAARRCAKAMTLHDQPAGERPLHRADDRRRARAIPATAAEATEQRAVALRQHDIGQPEEDRRGVDRQARQCALGDEGGVMIEREEHVGRPRRDRQRRDQRADHRARAFGDDGGRHHERRGDRHAQAERQDEGEFGGHGDLAAPGARAAHERRDGILSLGQCLAWKTSPHPAARYGADPPRRERKRPHTRFIDTETFGPFLMVW